MVINLGNIRQTHIKSVAIDLVKKYPDQFSGDFQNNKEKVDLLVTVSSNLLRNRIAGYITRYVVSRSKSKPSRPISE
jgi:small subunit ribosomal protein S17e